VKVFASVWRSNSWHLLRTNAGLLAIGEIIAFTPLRLLSLILIVFVLARLLPFGTGLFTKLIVSFGIIVSLVTYLAVIAWLVHLPLSSGIIVTILNICLMSTYLFMRRKGMNTAQVLRTNAQDCASLLVAIVTVLLVMWPVLQQFNGARLAEVVTAGGDNTAHLEMIKINDLNRGLPYGYHNRVNNKTLYASYPQGWHFMTAFVKWLSEPFTSYQNSPRDILLLFYLTASLWFGILMFLITRLACMVGEPLNGVKKPLATIAVVAVVTTVGLHWMLGLFMRGFQAQIASFTFCLFEIFFLIEAFKRPASKRYPALLLAASAAVSINFLWLFIAPIALGLLAAAFIITLFQNKRLPPLYIWSVLVFLGGLAAVQPLLYKLYPVNLGIPLLMQRGDAQQTSMYTLFFMCVIIAGYTTVHWTNRSLRIVFSSALLALAFSLYLFEDQLHTLHELRYFYFKSTYLFIMLATVILGAIAYELLNNTLRDSARKTRGRLHSAILITLVLISGSMICWQVRNPFTDRYVQSTLSGIDIAQAQPLIDAVSLNPGNGYYTVFLGACDRGNDIRASQLLESLSFVVKPQSATTISFDPAAPEETEQFQPILNATKQSGHTITVISSDQVLEHKLRAYLGDQISRVAIISINGNPQSEPISQCPNRTRDLERWPL
jgi:hypothetical protein